MSDWTFTGSAEYAIVSIRQNIRRRRGASGSGAAAGTSASHLALSLSAGGNAGVRCFKY